MDFFAHQARARKRSIGLILFFVLAVVLLVASVDAVALLLSGFIGKGSPGTVADALPLLALVTLGVLVLVGAGTLYKSSSLSSGGGAAIAMGLGGRRVLPAEAEPADRQLLNIVEEMALASGVPTPQVFVMEEQNSINAFAAGLRQGDAVVAVTRGALDHLDRDELQGVVAHEFSHILNGDMRLNLRLIGMVHGILVLALTGRVIIYGLRHVRVRGKAGAVIAGAFLAGLALFVLGYVGYAAGRVLRAAVNRQREFLADAAAIQFTRNPAGLSGAFQKLLRHGTRVRNANTAEASHLFFGSAVKQSMFGFLATHPPLEERLDRIDPGWRTHPVPDSVKPQPASRQPRPAPPPPPPVPMTAGFAAAEVPHLIGRLDASSPERGVTSLGQVPEPVRDACREPFTARAAILAAVADSDPAVARLSIQALAAAGEGQLAAEVLSLHPRIAALGPEAALSVVLLAIPALGQLSERQARDYVHALRTFVASDGVVTLHEHALAELTALHLGITGRLPRRAPAAALRRAMAELLGVLARHGAGDDEAVAERLYDLGRQHATLPDDLPPRPASSCDAFHASLLTCRTALPVERQRLVTAASWTVSGDGVISPTEEALMRLIADSLECPLPRLDPSRFGQPAS